MTIEEILLKYFKTTTNILHESYGDGAVNVTYRIKTPDNQYYILQKMNDIFDISIMEDIDVITQHLVSKEILTQVLLKTINGALFVREGKSWWRMLTYVEGTSLISMSKDQAREAGKLVGLFHTALLDCNYKFKYTVPHYHDTQFVINKLELTLEENKNTNKYLQLKTLAENVLDLYKTLPMGTPLPMRIIHGDLKISNVLFNESGDKAIAFIDLDTLMKDSIATELGDALRSWCMPGGEDTEVVQFNEGIYLAALDGYFLTATFLTENERRSVPYGVKMITLDLAARFIIDAFNENYFNLDTSKYSTLFEQNKKRAENQLIFFKEFSKLF